MSVSTRGIWSGTFSIGGNTNVTLTKPTGTAAGDLMIATFAINDAAATGASVTPTGWTLGGWDNDSGASGVILGWWWLLAGSSEPANYSWQFSVFTDGAAGIVSYTGCDQSVPIAGSAINDDAGAGGTANVVCPAVSWSGAKDVVSVCLMSFQPNPTALTPPAGFNDSTDGWTTNDGTEWGFHFANLSTQSAVTSLPTQTFTGRTGSSFVVKAQIAVQLAALAGGGTAGVRVANRNVGPQALRFRFRQPSYQSTMSSGPNSFTQSLSGGLSFTGPTNLKNATSKGLASAGLSFTGPTHLRNAITKGLAAAGLSFTGPAHLLNAISKGLTGGLSFTGSALRNAITKGLAAAGLSFTGPAHLVNAIAKGLPAAGLSFSGSIANAKAFLKSLTAGLSFTGPTRLGLSIGKGVTGGLTFTGAGLSNAISKGFAAGLSFVGNLAHTGGSPLVKTVNVALAVLSRRTVMLLRSRFPNLTLASRKSAATVRTRQVALTVTTRKTSLTVRSR